MPVAKHRKDHKQKVNAYKKNLRDTRKKQFNDYIKQLNDIILKNSPKSNTEASAEPNSEI